MSADRPLRGANILIVDDTPANLELMMRMLMERGYKARPVLSGRLALQAARVEPPDLILLDITMPDMNGYEVCEQLKADDNLKGIPVIFISSLNDTIDKVKAFSVGGLDYVTKPFHFEEVFARVQTHLELRRLEKLRDDLTHMIIHDLRNPLTVIFGFLDLVEIGRNEPLSADNHGLLTAARHSAEDMLNMISSILDVSKMGEGEMKLHCESCELDGVVRGVLDTMQPVSEQRLVTMESSSSALTVMLDATLVRRVLQNLLSNALKVTQAGGEVRVIVTSSDAGVRVAVIDAGPGIAPEYHERIFQKFGQVEDRRYRLGTGLGLTFCKMAVEAHGGRIGVDSEVGKGSTFWFLLPRLPGGTLAP